MSSSELILLAHSNFGTIFNTRYKSAKISTADNNLNKDDFKLNVKAKLDEIDQLNKSLKDSVKIYREVYLKDGVYTLDSPYIFLRKRSSQRWIRLLNENETDESILSRLKDISNVEILDETKNFCMGRTNMYLLDDVLRDKLKKSTNELTKFIDDKYAILDSPYGNYSIYWTVLKTKSFMNGLNMIGWTFINFLITILISFGRFFEVLFGLCHRKLSGEHNHSGFYIPPTFNEDVFGENDSDSDDNPNLE